MCEPSQRTPGSGHLDLEAANVRANPTGLTVPPCAKEGSVPRLRERESEEGLVVSFQTLFLFAPSTAKHAANRPYRHLSAEVPYPRNKRGSEQFETCDQLWLGKVPDTVRIDRLRALS